jgi:choline dehydrogenase-like flavoprotein
MAEAQFAAGARRVRPAHLDGNDYTTWPQAREAIGQLPLKKFRVLLFSAHLMGGCAMSEDPARGAVNSAGRHHQLQNLYVFDGSAFPTSIGANPQLSVFALTAQNASAMRKTIMA